MGFVFDVQDKAKADRWIADAKDLNRRAHETCVSAGKVLEEFQYLAEGQVFDKVVQYSGDVIEGVNTILSGMDKVIDTVGDVLKDIISKAGELIDAVGSTVSKVFG